MEGGSVEEWECGGWGVEGGRVEEWEGGWESGGWESGGVGVEGGRVEEWESGGWESGGVGVWRDGSVEEWEWEYGTLVAPYNVW